MSRNTMRANGSEIGLVGAGIGVVYLVIGIARERIVDGISGVVIIVGFLVLAYGLRRRSETAQLLSGPPADERQAAIMTRASALTGQILLCVLVVFWLVALSAGSDVAATLGWLCAVGGATFTISTGVLARRG